jgi:polyisoprenoid-binding protein YceI
MPRYSLVSLGVLLLCSSAAAQPVPWSVDANHSRIGFNVKHLGFAKVHGDFKVFSAKLVADAKTAKITELEAEADAKSVDTGIEKRDAHLRSDDFFGADQYPKLKLVVKNVQWRGKSFTATGALTIRDVTKNVKFQGEMQGPQVVNLGQGPHMRAAYHASTKINRKDFNLKFAGVAEGVALVGDDVAIEFETEISAPVAAAAPAKPAAGTTTPPAVPAPPKPGAGTTPTAPAPAPAKPGTTSPH